MKVFAKGCLILALGVIGFTSGYLIQNGHSTGGSGRFVVLGDGSHWLPPGALLRAGGSGAWTDAATNMASSVVAMVVGVVVAALAARWLSNLWVTAVGLAGLLVATIYFLLPATGIAQRAVLAGVAGGMLLGAGVTLARGRRAPTVCLAGGVIAAFLLADRLDAFRTMMSSRVPRRYADYLSTGSSDFDVWPLELTITAALAIAVAGFIAARADVGAPADRLATSSVRPVALGAALAGGLFVTGVFLAVLRPQNAYWLAPALLTVAVVGVVAWQLAADAAMLLAGLVVAAAAIPRVSPGVDGSWLSFAAAAGLLAAGLVVGFRKDRTGVGVGLCLLIAISGAWVGRGAGFAPQLAYLLLLPLAAGVIVASNAKASSTTVVLALVLPFATTVFGPTVVSLSGGHISWSTHVLTHQQSPLELVKVVFATVTVLACGAGIALLRRSADELDG